MNLTVLNHMSYGVYIVTTMDGDRPVGCTANSVAQVSADPCYITASIHHDNFTNECIQKAGKFAFSILKENSKPILIGKFGFRSSRNTDKFEGTEYEMADGMPVLKDSKGYVVCEVINAMETETHTIFLGKAVEGEVYDSESPVMTYEYYHRVIKGKSPKTAPVSYRE